MRARCLDTASVTVVLSLFIASCSGRNGIVPTVATEQQPSEVSPQSRSFDNTFPSYRLLLLPPQLSPVKINNNDVIVGNDLNTNAPLEYKDGHLITLPIISGDSPGDVFDINNDNQAVGDTIDTHYNGPMLPECAGYPCPYIRAVLWEHGAVKDLGAAPSENGEQSFQNTAERINDRGEIAGESGYPVGGLKQDALAIFSPGRIHSILVRGMPAYGEIFGINDSGEIVGESEVSPDLFSDESFAYPAPIKCSPPIATVGAAIGGINDAGDTLSTTSNGQVLYCDRGIGIVLQNFSANSLNDRGEIIGSATAAQPAIYFHGTVFRLNEGAPKISAPALNVPAISGHRFGKYFISSDGTVRGHILSISTGDALLYRHGKYYDLNNLVPNHRGLQIQNPLGLNDKGDVIGITFVCCSNPHFVPYELVRRRGYDTGP